MLACTKLMQRPPVLASAGKRGGRVFLVAAVSAQSIPRSLRMKEPHIDSLHASALESLELQPRCCSFGAGLLPLIGLLCCLLRRLVFVVDNANLFTGAAMRALQSIMETLYTQPPAGYANPRTPHSSQCATSSAPSLQRHRRASRLSSACYATRLSSFCTRAF